MVVATWFYLPRWFPNTYEAVADIEVDRGAGSDARAKGGDGDFLTLKETQTAADHQPEHHRDHVAGSPRVG